MKCNSQLLIISRLSKGRQTAKMLLLLMIIEWCIPVTSFALNYKEVKRELQKLNKTHTKAKGTKFTKSIKNLGLHFNILSQQATTTRIGKLKFSSNLNHLKRNNQTTQSIEFNDPLLNITSGMTEVLYDRDKEKENETDPGGGPASPEFSTFESVSTTDMVSPFTGDFSYNLPLLEIPGAHNGGYAVSLSYHNSDPESDASWVGYGWSLSPGAINRIKKGFPDDVNGANVEYVNDVPKNWTVSVAPSIGIEAFTLGASFSKNFRYNNYKGFGGGYSFSFSALKGLSSLSFDMSDGHGSFSPHINPSAAMSMLQKKAAKGKESNSNLYKLSMKFDKLKPNVKKGISNAVKQGNNFLSNYLANSIADYGAPSNVSEYTGVSYNFSLDISGDPIGIISGISGGLIGSYSEQKSFSTTRKVYGFLYSNKAENEPKHIMDYHIEKDASYMFRDQMMPIPFMDVDLYSVSGEGVSGSFRAFSRTPGLVTPPNVISTTFIENRNFQIHLGSDIGTGNSFNKGFQTLEMRPTWGQDGSSNNIRFPSYDPKKGDSFFFRFNNDPGGNVLFKNNFSTSAADLDKIYLGIERQPECDSSMVHGMISSINGTGRSGRSSFIKAFTNRQIYEEQSTINPNIPKVIPDMDITLSHINRNGVEVQDHIGLFSVVNESGDEYVYGLPVYSRNETNLQYNIVPADMVAPSTYGDAYIYANINDGKSHVGENHNYVYPSSYLLTSIRSTDYADVNNNGFADHNDYGGYSKFDYRRALGCGENDKKANSGNWYRWRTPFTGLTLNQGVLYQRNDDMGGFTCGEKEIYYLKTIETKTHVAVFVTNKSPNISGFLNVQGSQIPRLDGRSAAINNFIASNDAAAIGLTESENLERILLFAKPIETSGAYKLLKTIKFEYDYTTWPECSGSVDTIGKLTLKRVWTESEGISPGRVSPFEFKYHYPTDASTTYPSIYQPIANYYNNFNGFINGKDPEQPNYKDNNAIYSDRWGNYQAEGRVRKNEMNAYVDQTPLKNFDPAAWQLKQIKLPTGAEIHVQYEQDDYAFVQNRVPMVMASFKSNSESDKFNNYVINLDSIYRSLTTAEKLKYHEFLVNYFNENKYIYFKFLYNLTSGGTAGLPLTSNNECTAEYVDGYVEVNNISINTNGEIKIKVGEGSIPDAIGQQPFNRTGYTYPRYVCYDYLKTETGWQAGSCSEDGDSYPKGMGEGEAESIIRKLASRFKNKMDAVTNGFNTICATINPNQSFFKLPLMPTDSLPGKKGGGLRVKRILMFDKGLEATGIDKALYGTEYQYTLEDNKTSSGVASNEPLDGKEENALVDFIEKRDAKKWYQKAISGKDKEQFEGPYGESVLPSPSVGYSRVVSKNIYTGKTDAGFTVQEFFTTKDYPYDANYIIDNEVCNGVSISQIDKKHFSPPGLHYGLFNSKFTRTWATQGYRFILNKMDGMPKSELKYTGSDNGKINTSTNAPIYKKEFHYFQPGEKIPVIKDVMQASTKEFLGVETEIVSERKNVEDITNDAGLKTDAAVGFLGIIPLISGSGLPSISHNETKLKTMVTTKVIYLPTFLKFTEEYKDGMTNVTENLAFNYYTGKPVITKSYDEFNKVNVNGQPDIRTYFSYTQPACGVYDGMSQKAINDHLVLPKAGTISKTTSGIIKLVFSDFSNPIVLNASEGDLIKAKVISSSMSYYFYVKGASTNTSIYSIYLEQFNKAQSISYPFGLDSITVIKSGKTNQLDVPLGSISTFNDMLPTYKHPIDNPLTSARNNFVNSLNPLSLNGGTVQLNNTEASFIKGGTSKCLNCSCTSGLACKYVLVGRVVNNELYLLVTNINHTIAKADYVRPYIGCTPLQPLNCIEFVDTIKSCSSGLPLLINYQNLGAPGGNFSLDANSKYRVMYTPPGDEPIVVNILDFCNQVKDSTIIKNALSNSVTTFRNKWEYSLLGDYPPITSLPDNSFNRNIRGNWRMDESYVFKNMRTSANDINGKIYKTGTYNLFFYGWRNPALGNEWIRQSDVVSYSPNGEPVEERNAIEIPSASSYTMDKTLPSIVVENADHNSVMFESFENNPSPAYTGSFSWIKGTKHAGNNCVRLEKSANASSPESSIKIKIRMTERLLTGDIIVKFWATTKPDYEVNPNQPLTSAISINCKAKGIIGPTIAVVAKKIQSSGVWSLYEATFNVSPSISPSYLCLLKNTDLIFTITNVISFLNQYNQLISNNKTTHNIHIDDVIVRPLICNTTAYVYDIGTRRILTSFDDRHFGLYYLYNPEGKLTMKLAETERGIKMLDERQYNNAHKINQPN